MEDVERARERLDNIRSVKPILDGLRTISLGTWQAALKQRSGVRAYAARLGAILPSLLPHLRAGQDTMERLRERLSRHELLPGRRILTPETGPRPPEVRALVIGSERGLCGRFNEAVADEAERYLGRQSAQGSHVSLEALGSRAQRVLGRRGYEAAPAGALSVTTLPPLSLAFELARRWLTAYEKHELDAVHLVHNGYRGTGAYIPTVTQLIPARLPFDGAPRSGSSERLGPWPPPIIDTEPMSLYATVVEQWTAVHLHDALLNSSAAEHSTRFQLMESATQNADQLIEDLTLVIQTARRQEITQEMAELAAGAGLLGRDP